MNTQQTVMRAQGTVGKMSLHVCIWMCYVGCETHIDGSRMQAYARSTQHAYCSPMQNTNCKQPCSSVRAA